ncbi:diguanylate cyclase/phosphodiesterase (GGDEF & EAL domains) with PAS/PAC sensor(s) [hydrothermal vent metagenome]|uniref:Diguanylate cyclase/phosphodiesterase (GGDEF & EAL domains) with PAS/PAC sensor(S) n=1 Tax=hydrothermal vent metagenome TaxID=652676 RepID=A0A1W1D3C7_9ZZZZ
MLRVLFLFIFFTIFLQANEHIILQLKWKHSFQFAGFYMAKEKGFYQKAHLDVELKELQSNTNLVNDVLTQKATYGIGDSALIYYRLQKKPIVLMMPIFQTTPLALLTTKNVHSLKDFHSPEIFINKFSFQSPALLSMLHLSNIPMERFKTKMGVFSVEDMLKQKLDLYSVYIPNQPYYLKKHHINYHLFTPKDYGLDFYGDILFTSQKELTNHFNRAIAFMDASKKGWQYALSHIDETIQIIQQKYNPQHFSKEELLYQAKAYQKLISPNFHFNPQKIQTTKIIFKLLYKIKNDFNYKDFILNRYIATPKEREFIKNHKIRCITTTNWPPFNLIQKDKVVGLGIDYWNIVAKKLEIDNSCYKIDNFTTLLNDIKSKKADITISTSKTPDREKYALFSKPYVTFPIVIATKNDTDFIPNAKTLQDKVIAVVKNHTATKLFQAKYPNFFYKEVDTLKQALTLVKNNKAYATIEILPVLAYKINNENFNTLKISGKTELLFPVRFMIRKDYAPLLPIINRVIDSIDPITKKTIYHKWIAVHMQMGYSQHKVNKFILIAIAVFILFLLWIVILMYHIQKRKKVEAELEKLANYDKLTSIYNRHKIDEFLSNQMAFSKRYNKKLSLIFCDIDKFKKINDTFGHKVGDIILQEITQLISKRIRKTDGFGRWGGEEFLIVLPETNIQEATLIAEELRHTIDKNNFTTIKHTTCSFGVIEVNSDDTLDMTMKKVDELLYKAKENGRNRVVNDI